MIDVTMSLLDEIEAISREAGAAIMEVCAQHFSVQEERFRLTAADSATHGRSGVDRRDRLGVPFVSGMRAHC